MLYCTLLLATRNVDFIYKGVVTHQYTISKQKKTASINDDIKTNLSQQHLAGVLDLIIGT